LSKDIVGVKYTKGSLWDHHGGRTMGLRYVSNRRKGISLFEIDKSEYIDSFFNSIFWKVRDCRSTIGRIPS